MFRYCLSFQNLRFQKLSAKDRQKYEELQVEKKRRSLKKKTQTAVEKVKTEEQTPQKSKKKSATVVCRYFVL